MTPYVDFKKWPVTCRFGVQRPTGPHQGQDHGVPRGTPLFAPESGYRQLAIVRQHGDWKPDILWPNGQWWPYSRYYEYWSGGLCILWGTQYTHVWLHIDPSYIYTSGAKLQLQKQRKQGDYSSYVLSEVEWDTQWVNGGDVVALSGVSGYDDGPHVHYQLMAPGKTTYQVLNPESVWGLPDRG